MTAREPYIEPPEPDDQERGSLPSSLAETDRLLQERVKELACIHALSRLFDRRDATIEETLQAIVEVIPLALQYPEVAEACIRLHEERFQTPGFRDTPWLHSSPAIVQEEIVGEVSVCYREEQPWGDDGPFLLEEERLLDTVAHRISSYVDRRWTLKSLLAYQEDLRRLASALSASEQQERRRIAEGLHDHIGQNLALVSLRLGAVQQADTVSEAAAIVTEAREILADVINETRTLTFELCPPILYELGLGAGLDWLAEQCEATYGFRAIVREPGGHASLPEEVNATLFQAVREILTNAGRHAQATTVTVDIFSEDEGLRIVVEDDGIGFDVAGLASRSRSKRGFGLFTIREHLRFLGGALELDSEPGRGTTVALMVPYGAGSAGKGDGP